MGHLHQINLWALYVVLLPFIGLLRGLALPFGGVEAAQLHRHSDSVEMVVDADQSASDGPTTVAFTAGAAVMGLLLTVTGVLGAAVANNPVTAGLSLIVILGVAGGLVSGTINLSVTVSDEVSG